MPKYVRKRISPINGGELFAELTPRETGAVRLIAEELAEQIAAAGLKSK
ncbi:MAG: hypothetical protein K2J80_01330 [Oscillospiraceae bacterium]|nr:hypothetical protein [Oscillospiraceae bacterium]